MKEKTAVPVIVFFVIFFIAMSIYWHVANTKSYETGYSNGKEAGLNAAKSERLYWENRLYEAEQENYILLRYIMDFEAKQQSSMGDKVFAANGGLLPIDGIAINDSESGFLNKTGFSSPRDFFESFGIKIAEESDIPGWYNCYLPNGWTITLVNRTTVKKRCSIKIQTDSQCSI